MRQLISEHLRSIWRGLPIRIEHKLMLKDFMFKHLPVLFRWSAMYRNWQRQNSLAVDYMPSGNAFAATDASDAKAYFVPYLDAPPIAQKPVRLIAYYLPQFHAIPENNQWWGEGFTEWTNVRPAQPRFQGHYQPHVPADDLGYYDLLDPAAQRKQVELAKQYGLEGFCFYFYWFAGKRLLEAPILNYLNDPSLDLPFCLCWANENWSRRWDGLHNEILIAQQHSAEDDIAFIRHVAQYMRDPRYIRISGKPLLLVYRPTLLPSSKATAKRWREWCRGNGIGEIYLAYTQSFEMVKPAKYGYDAAVEFPPNLADMEEITEQVQPLENGFFGKVYDWTYFVKRSHQYAKPRYTLFRGVCPSWDNTARRKDRGTVFVNSSPALYRTWLANAIRDTRQRFADPDERLVFINAWNEWAEGAHLEPDARYGYAWLQATRDALLSQQDAQTGGIHRVLVVSHDAYPHGAQYLALHMVRELADSLHCEVEMVCLGNGPLLNEFAGLCPLHELAGLDPAGAHAKQLAADLFQRGFRHALVNTTVSGLFVPTLKQAGIRCVSLVHELREVILSNQLQAHAQALAGHADRIVFPAPQVCDAFAGFAEIPEGKAIIRPQGLYKHNRYALDGTDAARRKLREELGLPAEAKILLGMGYADQRKGTDYFVDIAATLAETDANVHSVWVGHWEGGMQAQFADFLARQPNIHFIGRREDTSAYYAGADVFALTSREDPFPSVVLESMEVGLPTVAFDGSGGSNALIGEGVGVNVTMGDTAAFAQAVRALLEDAETHARMARRGRELIAERFSFRHYLYDLLAFAGLDLRRVSVIVPNYNYGRYLPARLASIIGQSYPVYEILFLDDASQDNSLAVARKLLADSGIDHRILANETNSGSVFAQWRRGVAQARGDIVWIAEADDLSHPAFLRTVLQGFDDPDVALAYCESKQIDGTGRVCADNYHEYVADLGLAHWQTAYVNGGDGEIRDYLAVKNTIPNVSGVLMRQDKLRQVLDAHFEDIRSYRVAGDWKTYLHLLSGARLAYYPQSLNLHRRHSQGVTISSFDVSQLREIQAIQQWVAEHYACSPETQQRAAQYLDRLCEQFNVRLR